MAEERKWTEVGHILSQMVPTAPTMMNQVKMKVPLVAHIPCRPKMDGVQEAFEVVNHIPN